MVCYATDSSQGSAMLIFFLRREREKIQERVRGEREALRIAACQAAYNTSPRGPAGSSSYWKSKKIEKFRVPFGYKKSAARQAAHPFVQRAGQQRTGESGQEGHTL